MRSMLGVFGAIAIAVACAFAPGDALADACQNGCLVGSGVCRRQAALSSKACKMTCASNATPRACRRGCRATVRADRARCGTSLTDCNGGCPTNSTPGTCPARCGSDAETCFGGVRAGSKTCVHGCIAAGGSNLEACVAQCASRLESGAAACLGALGTCLAGCQGNVTGACFDTIELRCTDRACSPNVPCPTPNEFCAARCVSPPPTGTCFDPSTAECGAPCSAVEPCSAGGAFVGTVGRFCVPQCPPPLPGGTCFDPTTAKCGGSCSPTAPCPADERCVPACPPPPPTGKCFDTIARQCTTESCSPRQPCTAPNELCTFLCPPPQGTCLDPTTGACTTQACSLGEPCPLDALCVVHCPPPSSTTTTTLPETPCATDVDCDDGNGCTADRCVNGVCEHACMCLDANGATSCCPGPAAMCVKPCGADATGTCGGPCPDGATCEALPTAAGACGCVSGVGGPCGGNILAPPPVCAPGLVCEHANPDATGVCVESTCIPFFQTGCAQTSDCCQPCGNGIIAPCAVCLRGTCFGAP